jgi:hypothetical protein
MNQQPQIQDLPTLARPYHAETIEDFLNQLLWELRIDHDRWTRPEEEHTSSDLNNELLPFLARHASVLLPPIVFKNEDRLSADERRTLHMHMAESRLKEISALEMLMQHAIPSALCRVRQASSGDPRATITEVDPFSLLKAHEDREIQGS